MTDTTVRGLQRAFEQDPDDVELLQRLIAARRRAGEALPGWMLEREAKAPRAFESRLRFTVHVERVDGEVALVGATPGEVTVPEHQAWWVTPASVGREWPAIVDELRAQDVPGLRLDRSTISDDGLARLAELPRLTSLSLASCTRISDVGLRHVARSLPGLRRLNLDHCARAIGLEGLRALGGCPELVHLGLRGRSTDAWVELVLEVAPRLTQLRIGGAPITNEALRAAARLPDLTRLEVFDSGRVSKLGLEALVLGNTAAALAQPGRTGITHLDLVACPRITASALGVLAGLPRLACLGYHPVGAWNHDRPLLEDDLERLGELRGLRRLSLATGCMTLGARAKLAAALPDTRLVLMRDLSAYLDKAPE